MANIVVIFPVEKEASARAYASACDTSYANSYEPGGIFSYVRNDFFGQWVTPYYGPPWEFMTGTVFNEPSDLVPLRADGVLHDFAIWPSDD